MIFADAVTIDDRIVAAASVDKVCHHFSATGAILKLHLPCCRFTGADTDAPVIQLLP